MQATERPDRAYWRRVDEAFNAVVDLPEGERGTRVEELCGADAALRADVLRLLASDGRGDASFLEPPAAHRPSMAGGSHGPSATQRDQECAQRWVGRRIAGFTLTRCIGVGGMGAVYEALQERPRRTVALKLILGGLASPARLRRFVTEAEILADLHHPNIAQVYEAGTGGDDPDAVPYMALELIPGAISITQHARERKLDRGARLDLFLQVCDAVAYLHQRAVIYRDLKPANILVDTAGRPRVIDFGVARLVEADPGATRLTELRQLVGTLGYMSPEQIRGDPAQLDTRCDVYALGVILFELLTGRPPYEVRSGNLPEAIRAIENDAPPRPASLDRGLRGDLETIILKALEKDRQRRYAGASELGADLRRFLHDEPIAARPPSGLYQLRKFAQRHRALTGGAVLAMSGLVFGATVAAWQAARATDQRNRAVVAEQRALQAAARAAAEAEAAVRVSNCLGRVLSVVSRSSADEYASEDVPARRVLDQATAAVVEELKDQPLAQANLLLRLRAAYRNRGLYVQARDVTQSALEIRKAALPANDTAIAESTVHLGMDLYDLGEYENAERLLRAALAAFGSGGAEQQWHRALVRHMLGEVLSIQGRADEAVPFFQEALDIRRGAFGEAHWSYGSTLLRLTLAQFAMNDRPAVLARRLEAERLLELSRTLSESDPHRSGAPLLLGVIALGLGDPATGEPLLREAVAIRARLLGTEAFLTAYAESVLGACLFRLGRDDEAEALLVRSTRAIGRQQPPGNVMVVDSVRRTIEFYEQAGRRELAQPFQELLPSMLRE